MAKKQQKKSEKSKSSGALKRVSRLLHGRMISSDFFLRHWIPVLAVMAMLMTYITGKYICQTRMEEINRLNKQLEIVKAERVRERSLYMGRTSESSMQQLVDNMHLQLYIQEQPPYKLTRKK